ncbi:hypothetical protein D3C77_232570 [compost metagenome]
MSEKKTDRERFTVKMDDFIRFLEAKTSTTNCAACGHDHWTILGWSDTDVTLRLVNELLDGPKPESTSSFALFCNNCGFLRQHVSKVVRDWVDSNPEPTQLDLGGLDSNDNE